MTNSGTISINAKNMMPIIKKWLYSDKDIFLREIVSNACDAISKHKLLAQRGETDPCEDYKVTVTVDKANGTLSVSDNGIGMTGEEIVKYISQVAFSGAEDFLAKYKEEEGKNGIIGHFGLGFYSSFMVSSKVTIDTLSWQEGAQAVRWESDEGMEYTLTDSDRAERGTTVTMFIAEDDREFLEEATVQETLEKYCAFMPTPIYLNIIRPEEEKEEKAEPIEGEQEIIEVSHLPEQVNDPSPLWMKKPSECTDEEYRAFYRRVFHVYDEPLFWIHLNAEYPFNLKGILYFPKLVNEFTANEGKIKLYNNQVFVADNIKEVIPDFLMLLKGVIDCPDLPLNVSRSFLQNDGYVKRMQSYITRKVADRLTSEFNTKRADYEKYWDDIHPFVKYGCIRDEKFYERAKSALLFKTTEGEYYTLKEYGERNFTDESKVIYYTSDAKRQAHLVSVLRGQDKDVVLLETMIDNNFMSFLEYSGKDDEKCTFQRVDAGVDSLTEAGEENEESRKSIEEAFRKALGDETLEVRLSSFKTDELPAVITVDEQSRRFAEMSRAWGKGFNMPEKRTLTINAKHPLCAILRGEGADEHLRGMVCEQIYDLAEMARQPLESERMVAFLKRSNELLTMLANK
ncbi:MAG: molecular chaperone HtpG [Eubacteriales bacterium]|nr:molecular chaperone HtpG [Eubacteriales bacterium]